MVHLSLASIPEVLEDELLSLLSQRTVYLPQFNDLGPGDLIHLTKTGASKIPVGTFFYTAGVDASNQATIALHLMEVVKVFNGKSQQWFGKTKVYKVEQAVFCAFNAFEGVDVRVTIRVPGGVEVLVVGERSRGDRAGSPGADAKGARDGADQGAEKSAAASASDLLWLQTYVSSICRVMLTASSTLSELNHVVETRRINPFPTAALTLPFFLAFEALFFEGPKLGCACDVQTPTLTSNHLVDTFLLVVEATRQYGPALAVLERLRVREPSVVSTITSVLLLHQEVKAIQTIARGLGENPRNADLLLLQATYLLGKSRADLALISAIQAVRSAPSEFRTWEVLTKCYITLGEYDQALLTVNSCPMISKERYCFKRVTPVNRSNLHLPLPTDVVLDRVTGLNAGVIQREQDLVDPLLLNLPATGLKSTFALAYELLTDIIHRIGWEKLLRVRTRVFVMEEEYRLSGKFKTKRLCERWLDHLFMVLYDDLKCYTLWQSETLQLQAQNIEAKKSLLEWELLGLVATRLRYHREAAVAFHKALEGRFSVKATRRLLKYYLERRGVEAVDERILGYVVDLAVWDHRWYIEWSPDLVAVVGTLVCEKGLVRVQNLVGGGWGEDVGVVMAEVFQAVKVAYGDHELPEHQAITPR